MSEVSDTLLSLLLPEGILDYFELTKVDKDGEGFHFHLQEKDIAPEGYERKALESKGFLPESVVQDFPIRGQKAFLYFKRRRWRIISSGFIITRNWELVAKGTRITKEFSAFLKGIFG